MSQENVELVQRAGEAFEALGRRDLDGLLSLVHPDVEFGSLIAEMEGETYRGHDGVREWWRSVVGALGGGMRFELEAADAFRDRGIVRLRVVGTVEGVEVSNRQWMGVRMQDGLFKWWGVFRTEAEALEAVGLSE